MEEEYIDTRNTQQTYERTLARFKANAKISERNRQLILAFVRDAALGKTIIGRSKKKVGVARLHGYICHLQPLIDFVDKDLNKVTQEDMESFIEALEADRIRTRSTRMIGTATERGGEPFMNRTKVDIKVTIRKFYKWLWGDNRSYPKLVEWIDTYAAPTEVPALTEAEIQLMIDRAKTARTRALIQVLFDGGFRVGELLNVRLRHVWFRALDPEHPDEKCYVIRVPFSKTLSRTVVLPMPETTKWLTFWLEDHPALPRQRPDGTLEAKDTRMQLFPSSQNAIRLVLRRIGQQALGKRVYPHLLRHSSATYWSNALPYFKLCKRFGWTMTSKMPQRYIDREGVDEVDVARLYRERQHTGRAQGQSDRIGRG